MATLALAAFLAGLLGGVHCAGMCGGIVGSFSIAARGSLFARQFAFNAGRIASYAVAGAAVGVLGGLGQLAGPVLFAQTAMFALANMMMLMLGLYIAGWGRTVVRLERVGSVVWKRVEPIARRFIPIDTTAKSFGAGLAWGWVPCGLVYTMLLLALASGGPVSGAAVMVAFGLGTLPTLLAAGLAAQRLMAIRRTPGLRQAAGSIVIALAIVGLARVPGLQDMARAGWSYCVG